MATEIKVGIPRSAFFSAIGILVMAIGTLVNNMYIDKINGVNDKADENRDLIIQMSVDAKAERDTMRMTQQQIMRTLVVIESYQNNEKRRRDKE